MANRAVGLVVLLLPGTVLAQSPKSEFKLRWELPCAFAFVRLPADEYEQADRKNLEPAFPQQDPEKDPLCRYIATDAVKDRPFFNNQASLAQQRATLSNWRQASREQAAVSGTKAADSRLRASLREKSGAAGSASGFVGDVSKAGTDGEKATISGTRFDKSSRLSKFDPRSALAAGPELGNSAAPGGGALASRASSLRMDRPGRVKPGDQGPVTALAHSLDVQSPGKVVDRAATAAGRFASDTVVGTVLPSSLPTKLTTMALSGVRGGVEGAIRDKVEPYKMWIHDEAPAQEESDRPKSKLDYTFKVPIQDIAVNTVTGKRPFDGVSAEVGFDYRFHTFGD